jgi:hypothetical protein
VLVAIAIGIGLASLYLLSRVSDDLRKYTLQALLLAFSGYLIIISLFAAYLFDPKLSDFRTTRARLEDNLKKILVEKHPELDDASQSVTDDQMFDLKDPSFQQSIVKIKNTDQALGKYVTSLLEKMNGYALKVRQEPTIFQEKADSRLNAVLQHFEIQNYGRTGLKQAEKHANQLIEDYRKWVTALSKAFTGCRDAYLHDQGQVDVYLKRVEKAIDEQKLKVETSKEGGSEDTPRSNDPLLTSLSDGKCNFDAEFLNPPLPLRGDFDEGLGPVNLVAGWLLTTESRDIALIVGLLGFGLFGAIAAQFISPAASRSTKAGVVFVRGMAASVVVFLAIAGGLAVFTKDAIPNPFAVYFACLVAAVFSEDVWIWARGRQKQILGRDAPKLKSARNGVTGGADKKPREA